MTAEPTALPDGNIFMVSDRVIQVEQVETVIVAGFVIGQPGNQLQLHLTASGKLNNQDARGDVTLAFSPRDAFNLSGQLLDSLSALLAPGSEGSGS